MIFGMHCRYPRTYIHRHKQHKRPAGFKQEGPHEMHFLLHEIQKKIWGSTTNNSSIFEVKDPWGSTTQHTNKKIYRDYPHFTADNHFSGNHVLDLTGWMGFGLTLTAR